MIDLSISVGNIKDFPAEEAVKFQELLNVFQNNSSNNIVKNRYYEGKIPLSEVDAMFPLCVKR